MKNYKIVRISPMGHMLRRQLYVDYPELKTLPYDKQCKEILNGFYAYSGSFSQAMKQLGNDCSELIYDLECLQKQWAKENNIFLEEGKHWQQKIIAEQLKKIQPDVVYIQGISTIDSIYIESIREKLPNLKLIVQYSGFPTGWDRIDPNALLLVGTPYMVKQANDNRLDAHLVYHSFDPSILQNINEDNHKRYDFTFVGSSGFGFGDGHKSRYWDLLKLSYNTPLELWIDERELLRKECDVNPFKIALLEDNYYNDLNYQVQDYPTAPCKLSYLLTPEKKHAPVHGLDYFQLLNDSNMTFHRHTDQAFGFSGAMRLFEATGVGACLITDHTPNISELYDVDSEIVTYTNLDECVEKVNYLLENPKEMRAIAKAGQQKTLTQHTIKHRCEHIHELILSRLKQ